MNKYSTATWIASALLVLNTSLYANAGLAHRYNELQGEYSALHSPSHKASKVADHQLRFFSPHIYFLLGGPLAGKFLRYDYLNDKVDIDQPGSISKQWRGISNDTSQLISAALNPGGTHIYFFLRNGQYVPYHLTFGADAPRSTAADWHGIGNHAHKIRAVVDYPVYYPNDAMAYFFLSDGQYLRYNLDKKHVDPTSPRSIATDWPGLGQYARQIYAALNYGNRYIYFFIEGGQYLRYNIAQDRVDPGYPKMTHKYWPGINFQQAQSIIGVTSH